MASDNSFLDLKAGGRLKVVVPVFNSGHDQITSTFEQTKAAPLCSQRRISPAINLPTTPSWEIRTGSSDSGSNRPNPRKTGRQLPTGESARTSVRASRKRQHVRLLYLVRQSGSDHNMAIVASKHLAPLNSFTQRVKSDPNLCRSDGEIFCSWVPAGIAVRAE